MQFTVTYRSRSGTVETEVFDSASRAELFRQLQGRGISPIRVAEGVQGVKPKSGGKVEKGEVRRSFHARYWLMAVLAIAVGACVWFCVGPAKPRAAAERTVSPKPSSAKRVVVPNAVEQPTKTVCSNEVVKPQPIVAPVAAEPVGSYLGSEVVRRTFTTNSTGFVIERIFTADGRSHRKTHYPKSPFRAATDQYIAEVVSKSGGGMTPLPDLSHEKNLERDFMKSLEEPIEIMEGDSERLRELKTRVMIARETMRRSIESGASFAEVLENERQLANENSDIRVDALRELKGILAQGDRDGASKYVKMVNAALQQMGIEPLKTPKELKEEPQ